MIPIFPFVREFVEETDGMDILAEMILTLTQLYTPFTLEIVDEL